MHGVPVSDRRSLDLRDDHPRLQTMLDLEGEPRGLKTAVIQPDSSASRYSHARFMVAQRHALSNGVVVFTRYSRVDVSMLDTEARCFATV